MQTNKKLTIAMIAVLVGSAAAFPICITSEKTKLQKLAAEHENQLAQMHSAGYEQGYVSAIWDTFLDKPLYRIVEEEGGPTLWRKTEIDPVNKERLGKETPPSPEENTKKAKD